MLGIEQFPGWGADIVEGFIVLFLGGGLIWAIRAVLQAERDGWRKGDME